MLGNVVLWNGKDDTDTDEDNFCHMYSFAHQVSLCSLITAHKIHPLIPKETDPYKHVIQLSGVSGVCAVFSRCGFSLPASYELKMISFLQNSHMPISNTDKISIRNHVHSERGRAGDTQDSLISSNHEESLTDTAHIPDPRSGSLIRP